MADKITPEDLALSNEIKDIAKLTADQLERASAARSTAALQSQKMISDMQQILHIMEQKGQAQTDEFNKNVELLIQQQQEQENHINILDVLSEQIVKQDAITAAQEETSEAMAGSIRGLASLIGYSTEYGAAMKKAFSRKEGESFVKMLGRVSTGLIKGAASVFSLTNIVGALAQTFIDTAMIQDQSEANFVQMTGSSREAGAAINGLRQELFEYGMGLHEASAALGTLYNGVTGFSTASEETQMVIGETTATLDKLGVNMQDTAAITQLLSRSFGMTMEQGADAVGELAQFARDTGQNVGGLVQDFRQASKYLGVFGKDSTKVFMKTSKLARTLGTDPN